MSDLTTNSDNEDPEAIVSLTEVSESGGLSTKDGRLGKREDVRSKIALRYIYFFFTVILIAFAIGIRKDYNVGEYEILLITISGILSGPLGFIIGFYFKDATE